MSIADPAKREAYMSHVARCRACARCDRLTNPQGCDHPSPWATWMGSLEARVVVVGQDFSGTDRSWHEPQLHLATNRNLCDLIRHAGLDESRDVYLTNAILCLKPGGTSAPLRAEWVKNCAGLLRRTIDIVGPLAVAALGGVAWRALGYAFGERLPLLTSSVGGAPVVPPLAPALFAFNHCGGLGVAHRPLVQQREDWRRLGSWISARDRTAA